MSKLVKRITAIAMAAIMTTVMTGVSSADEFDEECTSYILCYETDELTICEHNEHVSPSAEIKTEDVASTRAGCTHSIGPEQNVYQYSSSGGTHSYVIAYDAVTGEALEVGTCWVTIRHYTKDRYCTKCGILYSSTPYTVVTHSANHP